MVVLERKKKAAFYCRRNHTNRNYARYLDDVDALLAKRFPRTRIEKEVFFEIASGADPDRIEFNRLKEEIKEGKIEAVVTFNGSTIARDWKQFIEFMKLCDQHHIPVLCLEEKEDADRQYQFIKQFCQEYFGGGGIH